MNPLLILGGLGILGFLMMGYKKKPTWTPVPYIPTPGVPDPNEPPAWSRLAVVPGRIA